MIWVPSWVPPQDMPLVPTLLDKALNAPCGVFMGAKTQQNTLEFLDTFPV